MMLEPKCLSQSLTVWKSSFVFCTTGVLMQNTVQQTSATTTLNFGFTWNFESMRLCM